MDDGELRAHFERIDERFRESDERFDRMATMRLSREQFERRMMGEVEGLKGGIGLHRRVTRDSGHCRRSL